MSNGHPASLMLRSALDPNVLAKAAEREKSRTSQALLDSAAQVEADKQAQLEVAQAAEAETLRLQQEAEKAALDSANSAAEAEAAARAVELAAAEAAAAEQATKDAQAAAELAAAEQAALDSASAAQAQAEADAAAATAAAEQAAAELLAKNATFDDANGSADPAAQYAASSIAVNAIATLQEWVETDDLTDGETMALRLQAYFAGIADGNQDGELDDDEFEVFQSACDAAWDYLLSKGVTEEDCNKLFNDWDDDVAQRVRDVLASTLPDGDEAAADEIDSFVFGDSDQEGVFDAVYKKRLVIRDGKKTRINKRVSGTIRLSAAQKVGIRKAQLKSHNATAQMRRSRSVRKGKMMGLGAK